MTKFYKFTICPTCGSQMNGRPICGFCDAVRSSGLEIVQAGIARPRFPWLGIFMLIVVLLNVWLFCSFCTRHSPQPANNVRLK